MNGTARISIGAHAGMVLMPVQTAYDTELVLDEARFAARRHGEARIDLGAETLVVRHARRGAEPGCSTCSQRSTVTFARGDHRLCPRCARRALLAEMPEEAVPNRGTPTNINP